MLSWTRHAPVPTPTVTITVRPAVAPGDVCDQGGCPAAVQVAVFTAAGPLGFCLHHFRRHADTLLAGDYAAATLAETGAHHA